MNKQKKNGEKKRMKLNEGERKRNEANTQEYLYTYVQAKKKKERKENKPKCDNKFFCVSLHFSTYSMNSSVICMAQVISCYSHLAQNMCSFRFIWKRVSTILNLVRSVRWCKYIWHGTLYNVYTFSMQMRLCMYTHQALVCNAHRDTRIVILIVLHLVYDISIVKWIMREVYRKKPHKFTLNWTR